MYKVLTCIHKIVHKNKKLTPNIIFKAQKAWNVQVLCIKVIKN